MSKITFFLPQTAEYALRAMVHLALMKKQFVPAKDLSHNTGIPSHYLSKIMRKLVASELVEAQKGHGGGFIITKDFRYITVQKILDGIGFRSQPEHCVFGWGKCESSNPCPMHNSWSELNQQFQAWAEKTTLAKLHQEGKRLDFGKTRQTRGI